MNKSLYALMLVIPMSISIAYADDAVSKYGEVAVSGFGTMGYTRLSTDDAQFARPNQINGVGTKAGYGVDTDLGLQATSQLNKEISVTGQTLIRKDASDTFKAELAWAFAKYKINDDFSVRAGRLGLPAFMISDYRNVGFANTMIRPLGEVYSQVPFGHIDGVDATYTANIGKVLVTSQVAFGRTTAEIAKYGNIKASNELGFNLSAEYGPLTVRLGRVDTTIDLPGPASFQGLLTTLNAIGFNGLSNDLSASNKKASFTSVGAIFDLKNYLIQTEYAKRKTDSFIADTTSYYVMGGYRIGNFLPYVAHSSLRQDSPRTTSAIPAVGPLLPLIAGVNSVLQQSEQTSNTVGVRWDFRKNTALKIQIDRITPHNGPGLFAHATPGYDAPATVIGAALDFVF